jgi:hypothetical protein|tara:strand:+ start:320 stop:619 length:300 start_codon:yes stop_codon:yes gene_type:complete
MTDYEDIEFIPNERRFWVQVLNEIRDLKTRDGIHYLAISKLGSQIFEKLTRDTYSDQDDVIIQKNEWRKFLIKVLGTTREDSSMATKLIGKIRHIKKHF